MGCKKPFSLGFESIHFLEGKENMHLVAPYLGPHALDAVLA